MPVRTCVRYRAESGVMTILIGSLLASFVLLLIAEVGGSDRAAYYAECLADVFWEFVVAPISRWWYRGR